MIALLPGHLRCVAFVSRRRRVTAALACSLSLAACGGSDAASGDAPVAQVVATIDTVRAESFAETIDASGLVVVRAGRVATLAAPASTRITNVHVAVGSHVRKGQQLISLDRATFDAAVISADAALHSAELARERAERLVNAGVSPRKELEAAEADAAAARAASVAAHRVQTYAEIESPIDGVVTRLDAVLGAGVDAGMPLVEVSDVRALDVQLVLSPAQASRVHVGHDVELRESAAADAPVVARARVVDVSAMIDSVTRGVPVRAMIVRSDRQLSVGEGVFGRVQAAMHDTALVINDAALVPNGDAFQVFVVDSAGAAHATPVEIGGRDGHRVWIVSGLSAGARIVTSGAYGLDDGAIVVTSK